MNANVIEATISAAKLPKAHASNLRTLLRSGGENAAQEALAYILKHSKKEIELDRIERLLGITADPVESSGNVIGTYRVHGKYPGTYSKGANKWYNKPARGY
jgi:hypothetical protein